MKLEESYFEQDAETVAKGLLGRYLVSEMPKGDKVKLKLTEIAAYEGATKTTSKGASYTAGKISISTKFGKRLMDIATGKKKEPSCITIRAGIVQLEDIVQEANGPGKVTELLGITKTNKDLYDDKSINGKRMYIEGKSIDQSRVKHKKRNSENCVGIYRI